MKSLDFIFINNFHQIFVFCVENHLLEVVKHKIYFEIHLHRGYFFRRKAVKIPHRGYFFHQPAGEIPP